MTRIRMGLVLGLLLAFGVAGCGGGSGGGTPNGVAGLDGKASTTSPGGGKDRQQQALAYARCMRQHGVNTPDPQLSGDGEGRWDLLPEGVSPDDPKFKAAQQACQQYLPNGGQPRKLSPQQQLQLLALARCMRQQGINLPDPKPDGGIDMRGVDSDTPKFQAAQQACQQYQPDGGKQSSSGGDR
jgi:hypothetical protein